MTSTGLKNLNCDTIETDFIIVKGEDLLVKMTDISNNLNTKIKDVSNNLGGQIKIISDNLAANYYDKSIIDSKNDDVNKKCDFYYVKSHIDISYNYIIDNFYDKEYYDTSYNYIIDNVYDKEYYDI